MEKTKVPLKFLKVIITNKKIIRLYVSGNSMYPLLCDGDQINILRKSQYNIGDVIVFYYDLDKNYLIHRIVAKHGKFLYIKGDNAYRIEKIRAKNIIGYVRFDYKRDRYLIKDYCKSAYKLGLYAKRVKYNMKKIYNSQHYNDFKRLKRIVINDKSKKECIHNRL